MILSTLLSNIIGIYVMDDASRLGLNSYKQSYLYDDTYKHCASLHYSTKIFGEPLQCIDDSFIVAALETLGAQSKASESPDLIHLKRTISPESDVVGDINIISNREGQVLRVEANISDALTIDELRGISNKISAIHGQPDVTPPNPHVPLWGWKASDGYEIRLFLDVTSRQNKISITHHQAYDTLRQFVAEPLFINP